MCSHVVSISNMCALCHLNKLYILEIILIFLKFLNIYQKKAKLRIPLVERLVYIFGLYLVK